MSARRLLVLKGEWLADAYTHPYILRIRYPNLPPPPYRVPIIYPNTGTYTYSPLSLSGLDLGAGHG